MNSMVENKVQLFPESAQAKFCELRSMIFGVAEENSFGPVEETLKWGEPAYLNERGSTIRIDWKPSTPEYIYVFFNCKTSLVETYKEVFFDVFKFQDNRAIILDLDKPLPEELRDCFLMALNYHYLKKLPLLGA